MRMRRRVSGALYNLRLVVPRSATLCCWGWCAGLHRSAAPLGCASWLLTTCAAACVGCTSLLLCV